VNKTLLRYLGLDLLKATGLTLIVLTLTLTTLGIIEPLRKQGLDAQQVLAVFVMTLPVMLSFTMPFAALFAACFVYGRFSQDNELLASRASGISTLSVLKPALALGIVVTLISWLLSNNLAPIMARRGTEIITSNVRGIMCRKLAVNGFLGFQDMTIHADRVYRYPDKDYDKLHGVVVIKRKDDGTDNVEIVSARAARARFGFNHTTYRAYGNFTLDNAVVMNSAEAMVRMQTTASVESVSFDRRIKEKPAWYSWNELQAALDDPSMSITVQQAIPKIRQAICNDIFAGEIIRSIRRSKQYNKLYRHNVQFLIKAPRAKGGASGEVLLNAGGKDEPKFVEITEVQDGKPLKTARVASAVIRISWDKFTRTPGVSITLNDKVFITDLTVPKGAPTGLGAKKTRENVIHGQVTIPADVRAKMDAVTPYEAYHNGGKGGGLTNNPAIHRDLKTLNDKHVVKLKRDIISEMHTRAAYSLSCLLMVMLGGVLGLIFRGGHFVSALFTSMVPATMVIVTILMGKNIAQNPDILLADNPYGATTMGLAVIWGGITLLAIITGLIYWRVSKK